MKNDLEKVKTIAVRAAKRSGAMLLREFAKFDRRQIKIKSKHEMLTKADLASERIIIGEISKNCPEHHILAEESGESGVRSEYTWVVDPLDGSTNFSIHNPVWSVSIALTRDGIPIFGLVYVPYLKELYLATASQGATRNGKPIRVSDITGDRSIHTFCHSSDERDIKLALKYYQKQKLSKFDCRQLGSAAAELAFVASGRVESILIPGARAWDVAAGALLVSEAGGLSTDFSGRHWSLSSHDILSSNGLVHEEVLTTVKRL